MIIIRWKNYENSTFFPIWPLVRPSKISLAFFIFLRSLMPKKSSGMQKILFRNRISPQKINKPKIPFYTITYKSRLTQKKLYKKTDAIFSIYGRNGIKPWHFFFEFSLGPFEVVEAEGGRLVKEANGYYIAHCRG